ncbi:MAG: efflux transporter outer membrane subunit [Verrucomicrobiae bacterium]|nr:efflux transporter outer membrane subunit [Verrucomicrobiae bacterium]
MILAACTPVGPDHQTPAMELPASFSQGGVSWKRQSPGSQPLARSWWRVYRDPTLNSLVERALAGNQNLKSAAASVAQARALSRAARTLYFPEIDLGAGGDRSKMRIRMPGGGTTIMNSFSIPADMSYELDVWGKVRRQVEAAEASEGAATESLNAMRLSIAGEVAQTYWALRAVDADRKVLDETLEIRRKSLDLLGKRREAGTLSGLDYSRAENEVASAEADRIQLDQQRSQLVNALAVLCGSVATGSAVSENASLPNPPAFPVSVPSALLRQRPDIRAAEHRVAAANADIGVATAAFYPSFRINASGGLDSAVFSNLFEASSLVWSLGADASVPLTRRGNLRAQRDAAVAAHEAASADYRQIVLDAIREVEDSLQGGSILARRHQAQDKATAAARKTFELSSKQYQAGLISFLDVVDAERTRLDAERAANAIRAERLAISVSLAKALGGEW